MQGINKSLSQTYQPEEGSEQQVLLPQVQGFLESSQAVMGWHSSLVLLHPGWPECHTSVAVVNRCQQ